MAKKPPVTAVKPPPLKRRPVAWVGAAKDELIACPVAIRSEVGHQLFFLQNGEEPTVTVKPVKAVGDGCYELIVNDKDGWFRVFYVSRFHDALYVLHCFQKKTNQTPKPAIQLGQQRYKDMMASRSKK